MNKFLTGYVTGVVTAPAVYFIFRKPLMKYVAVPALAATIMSEEMDKTLFEFMSARLDFQELRKKHGTEIHQLKAQGYKVPEIAKKVDLTEKQVKLLLISGRPEE